MQRGILLISREELIVLYDNLDIEIYSGSALYEKLNSALQGSDEEIRILLSEDEIEKILDEVGPPIHDNDILNSSITKIFQLLSSFRDK